MYFTKEKEEAFKALIADSDARAKEADRIRKRNHNRYCSAIIFFIVSLIVGVPFSYLSSDLTLFAVCILTSLASYFEYLIGVNQLKHILLIDEIDGGSESSDR